MEVKFQQLVKGMLSSILHYFCKAFSLFPLFYESPLSSKVVLTGLCQAIFTSTCCVFQYMRSKREIGHGLSEGTFYYLRPVKCVSSKANHKSSSSTAFEWHIRLGHPNFNKLKLMVPSLDSSSQFLV